MLSFFHGWRRKAGVVLLVMALAFFGVWMRSYFFCDEVSFPSDASALCFDSVRGGFNWYRLTPCQTGSGVQWNSFNLARMNATGTWSTTNVDWRWDFGGFSFGVGTLKSDAPKTQIELWHFPFWALVLPPTLLSAYLILWKPQKRTGPDHA